MYETNVRSGGTHEAVPTTIRMQWLDFSPALQWHARDQLGVALRPFREALERVEVEVADEGDGGSSTGASCRVTMALRTGEPLVVTANAEDPYVAVSRAADCARTAFRRHLASIDAPSRVVPIR